MSYKDLSKIYYINLEIEQLEEKYKSISIQRASCISDTNIHSGKISNPTEQLAFELEKYQRQIFNLTIKKQKEVNRLMKRIENIDDPLVRIIATYRCVDCMDWRAIGEILNYDPSGCCKKLKNYLNDSNSNNSTRKMI